MPISRQIASMVRANEDRLPKPFGILLSDAEDATADITLIGKMERVTPSNGSHYPCPLTQFALRQAYGAR